LGFGMLGLGMLGFGMLGFGMLGFGMLGFGMLGFCTGTLYHLKVMLLQDSFAGCVCQYNTSFSYVLPR
jgi:hypothetical protein